MVQHDDDQLSQRALASRRDVPNTRPTSWALTIDVVGRWVVTDHPARTFTAALEDESAS